MLKASSPDDKLFTVFDPSGGDILSFAYEERSAGRPVVVVTLVEIDGSSPRALGAQMAVAEDGRFVGSITSGCLERAIVDEARAVMERKEGGLVRYGAGSQFADIVLPCGSGIDLLFTFNPSLDTLQEALELRRTRQPFAISFATSDVRLADQTETSTQKDSFVRAYTPPLRIIAAGIGAELIILSGVASAAGYEICALSPDAQTLTQCKATQFIQVNSSSSLPGVMIDQWSAFVMLFHDREWELALAPMALASPAFYIGAVGSKKTHALRLEALIAEGADAKLLERLNGQIGLIPATRDPSALAVSILAGVIAAWPH